MPQTVFNEDFANIVARVDFETDAGVALTFDDALVAADEVLDRCWLTIWLQLFVEQK